MCHIAPSCKRQATFGSSAIHREAQLDISTSQAIRLSKSAHPRGWGSLQALDNSWNRALETKGTANAFGIAINIIRSLSH